jgi:hypothetical protein
LDRHSLRTAHPSRLQPAPFLEPVFAYRPDSQSLLSEDYLADLRRLLEAVKQRKQTDLVRL